MTTKPASPGSAESPVPRLIHIRTAHHLSEETPAFTATLKYKGKTYKVQNAGQGGGNHYFPPMYGSERMELNEWAAKTFPPITECGGCPLPEPVPMDFETWTFQRAFEA